MFGHYYSQTDMPVGSILGVKCYGDVPCMFFFLCIMTLMTAEHQEAGVGKCLVDELNLCYHPLLPVQITGPERGHEESTLRFRELKTVELQKKEKKKKSFYFSVSFPVIDLICFYFSTH